MTEEEKKFVERMEKGAEYPLFESPTQHAVDRLCRIIRSYEKMLAEGVVVFGDHDHKSIEVVCWRKVQYDCDTHRARLVQIEEIEK